MWKEFSVFACGIFSFKLKKKSQESKKPTENYNSKDFKAFKGVLVVFFLSQKGYSWLVFGGNGALHSDVSGSGSGGQRGSFYYTVVLLLSGIWTLPWDDVLGSVEDFMAGFGGLESAEKGSSILFKKIQFLFLYSISKHNTKYFDDYFVFVSSIN